MKKITLFFVGALLLVVLSNTVVMGEGSTEFTNVEFAQLLTNVLGLDIPAGSEDLSEGEYFEVLSNLLFSKGVPYFAGKSADAPVQFSEVVTVLYGVVGGPEGADTAEKLKYLSENYGLMTFALNSFPSFEEIAHMFNNPVFAPLIAEGYSAAEALRSGGGADRADAQAPGFRLEGINPTSASAV